MLQMADSEVLAREIALEMLGSNTDKGFFGFFRDFYGHFFVCTTRVSFVHRKPRNCQGKALRLSRPVIQKLR